MRCAGAALVRCFDLVRARQFRGLLRPAGALAMVSLVVFSNLGLDNGLEANKRAGPCGSSSKGRSTRRAGMPSNRYLTIIVTLGFCGSASRRRCSMPAARMKRPPSLVEANAIDGPRPAIRLALGEALIRTGRAADAVGHLEAAYDSWCEISLTGPLLVRALVLAGRARRGQTVVGNGGLGQEPLRNLRSTSGRWHSSKAPCSKRSDGCRSR